jgi:hypothetical protein
VTLAEATSFPYANHVPTLQWLVAALKKGKKIDDFLIERRRATRS